MTFPDLIDEDNPEIRFTPLVEGSHDDLVISFPGYSAKASGPNGQVVSICVQNGHPVVRVWADIQQEDASDVISLEHARESEREPEDTDDCGAAVETGRGERIETL